MALAEWRRLKNLHVASVVLGSLLSAAAAAAQAPRELVLLLPTLFIFQAGLLLLDARLLPRRSAWPVIGEPRALLATSFICRVPVLQVKVVMINSLIKSRLLSM